ncbi:MAG: hypothetical protein WD825_17035 [Gemmatimonadaceae bacterium]
MNLTKLFLLMILLGGAGGALGSMAGNALGRGGVVGGGLVAGAALVVVGGFLGARWGWIKRSQRLWATLGGVFGFGLATMVTLSTLSSPVGPILSTLLIGTGAVLGAVVGNSPHAEA